MAAPAELYARPASLFVASFVGAPPINVLAGRAEGAEVVVNGLRLGRVGEGGAAGEVVLGIRPEHIRFDAHGLAGRIDQIEPMGRETLYLVETPMGGVRVLEGGAGVRFALGDSVRIGFRPEDSLLFDRESGALVPGARVAPPAG